MNRHDLEQRVNVLVETLATREHEIAVLKLNGVKLAEHLTCDLIHPDKPEQPHGYSAVCERCYEALRVKYIKAELLVESINKLVHVWMMSGRECPFCQHVLTHTKTCYLAEYASTDLLAEYEAIEQHRDQLLDELARVRPTGHLTQVSRVSLKARLRQDITRHRDALKHNGHANHNGRVTEPSGQDATA